MTRGLATVMTIWALIVAATTVEAWQGRGQAADSVLTPEEQRTVDLQLAPQRLDPAATVTGLAFNSTVLKDVIEATATAGRVTLRWDAVLTNLDKPFTLTLQAGPVENAFHAVLDANGLAFAVTGARAIFIYADTPANREKYRESVRTFPIVNADLQALSTLLNRSMTGLAGPRPVIVTSRASRTISVRATTDAMAQIARLIAENDKK